MKGDRLRVAILILFLAASAGMLAELLLLAHTEGALQLIPVVLLGAGAAAGVWAGVRRSRPGLHTFRVVAGLQVLAGVVGLVLHYRSNVEFELEMQPNGSGTGLIWAALTGAIPALAPGAMIQLGVLGLLFTYAHPALARHPPFSSES